MALLPPSREGHWADRLTRSGYFFVAVLFHLVLFLMIATYIVWPPKAVDQPMQTVNLVVINPPKPPPPPVTPDLPKVATADPDSSIAPPVRPIFGGGDPSIHIPAPSFGDGTSDDPHPLPPAKPKPRTSEPQISKERIPLLQRTVQIWNLDPNSDPTMPKAQFVVYIAAYADGDWDCNTAMTNGAITAGGIPNLAEKIQQWSHGNTQASVVPTPLQIGSRDLLDKMPPFIFFTGHKDFKLTEQEVKNLQAYLNAGGAIWGDNALAGEGSRFDVAFRREMRRVIPDKDKDFVPLDLNHDIFKNGKFPMDKIPEGVNYYAESIEHIDIEGKLAILYTPNDYSDLMFMRILPGDKAVDTDFRVTATHTLYTNPGMLEGSHIFYRNFDLQSSLTVDHLGMDIITHLLMRFQDVLQFAH